MAFFESFNKNFWLIIILAFFISFFISFLYPSLKDWVTALAKASVAATLP